MKPSTKPNAPQYSFGTGKRSAAPKRFVNKEFDLLDRIGKGAPKGPNYNVADNFKFTHDPQWKIGTTPRNPLDIKPKY